MKSKQISQALRIKKQYGTKAAAKYLKNKGFSIEATLYLLLK